MKKFPPDKIFLCIIIFFIGQFFLMLYFWGDFVLNELLNFNNKILALSSLIFSGASSLISIIPFFYVWKILRAFLFSEGLENISRFGIFAVIFAVIAILFYVAALILSHLAAFKTSSDLRAKLPDNISLNELENYLAHYLPEKYSAIFLSLGLVVILFWVDWLLALVSLAPIILGFIIMAMMTGENVRKKIIDYQNSLRLMSKESYEYIRGIPAGKNSLKKYQSAIQNYIISAIAYTNELRIPMMFFMLAVNGSLFFLICAGVFVGVNYGFSREFITNFLFAVLVAPLISITLMRMLRQNENAARAAETFSRISAILKGEK